MTDTTDDELLQIDNCIDTLSSKMTTASDFQRLLNAITTNLNKINTNTNDLEKLVQILGTPDDSEPLRDRYLRLQNETKSLMQQTNASLQQLHNIHVVTEADQRRKKTLTESLPKQYLDTVNRFQKAQRIGAQKEKESLDRARSVSYRRQSTDTSQFADNFGPPNNQLQQQVVIPMEQEVDIRGLQERGDQLRQLETNIVEVNELFKDVAKLVHEQGDIIDTIDKHIVETEVHVDTGNQHLTKAVTYQSAARRKKILLVVILIIVLIIVALVLYFTLRKK